MESIYIEKNEKTNTTLSRCEIKLHTFKEWKIYNGKVGVVCFVIECGRKMTIDVTKYLTQNYKVVALLIILKMRFVMIISFKQVCNFS